MFKIQLSEGEFYKNSSSRVQHFKTEAQGKAKIDKLGNIASGATVVECKAKTAAAKTEKETAFDTKVKFSKKKAASKSKKPASSNDKTKQNKKA